MYGKTQVCMLWRRMKTTDSGAAVPSYTAHFLKPTRLAPLTIAVPLAGPSGDSRWFSRLRQNARLVKLWHAKDGAKLHECRTLRGAAPHRQGYAANEGAVIAEEDFAGFLPDFSSCCPAIGPTPRMVGVASRDARGLRDFGDGRCCLWHDQLGAGAGRQYASRDLTHQQST